MSCSGQYWAPQYLSAFYNFQAFHTLPAVSSYRACSLIMFLLVLLFRAFPVYSACFELDLDRSVQDRQTFPGLSHTLYTVLVSRTYWLSIQFASYCSDSGVSPSGPFTSSWFSSAFCSTNILIPALVCRIIDLSVIPKGMTRFICMSLVSSLPLTLRCSKWYNPARSSWHRLSCELKHICGSWLSLSDCHKWNSVINLFNILSLPNHFCKKSFVSSNTEELASPVSKKPTGIYALTACELLDTIDNRYVL